MVAIHRPSIEPSFMDGLYRINCVYVTLPIHSFHAAHPNSFWFILPANSIPLHASTHLSIPPLPMCVSPTIPFTLFISCHLTFLLSARLIIQFTAIYNTVVVIFLSFGHLSALTVLLSIHFKAPHACSPCTLHHISLNCSICRYIRAQNQKL